VTAITAIAGDVRIDAQEVPRRIGRKAYKLFEAIAIATGRRSRTPLWPSKREQYNGNERIRPTP
jgi:hypothetical protein